MKRFPHSASKQATPLSVPQAKINPQPIRLPIVDATDIRFTRLSTSEGIMQSKAGHMVQDNQGFIWLATPYGLSRFDGYSFKSFTHDPRNPKSLSGEFITALFKDRMARYGSDALNSFTNSTRRPERSHDTLFRSSLA